MARGRLAGRSASESASSTEQNLTHLGQEALLPTWPGRALPRRALEAISLGFLGCCESSRERGRAGRRGRGSCSDLRAPGGCGSPPGWSCEPSAGRDAAAAGTPGGVPAPLGSPREPCDGSTTPNPAPFTAQTPGCGPRPPPAAYLRLLGVAAGRENQLGAGAGGCEPPHQPQPDAPAAAGDEHGAAAGLGHAGTAFSTAFSTALSALTAAPRGS